MGKRYGFLLKVTLLFIDLFSVNSIFIVAHWLMPFLSTELFLIDLLICNLLWVASAALCKLYKSGAQVEMGIITNRTIKTIVVNVSLQMLLFTLVSNIAMPAHIMLSIMCTYSFSILISRFFITDLIEFFVRKARLHKKTAIVGYNETAIQLAQMLQQKKSTYLFEGFFDNNQTGGLHFSVDAQGQIVGSIEHCIDYAVKNDIREIYSTILPEQNLEMQKLVEVADQHCVRVKFVPASRFDKAGLHHVEYFDKLPVISLRAEPLQNLSNRMVKRAVDIAVSSFVMVFILSWLVPIIGIIIKLQSKGPVFFKQQRSGKDNETFWCYKFRSMTVNSNSDKMQATKNDARVTRIGAFLRKTSLDEFPQFWNVFIGDMSIVGPRPHMLVHTEMYSAIINKYMIRQFLKPGITGWAQANGYRGETQDVELMKKRVEHDIWYMENWSPKLDLIIFMRTFFSIFLKEENAY